MTASEQAPIGRPQAAVQPGFDPTLKPRILIVDGDQAVADLTGRVLQRHGFDVLAAHDGVEAVTRWATDAPDLVLLEVNLARRSGFEVCADIRRQSSTPVVMLTTCQDEEDVLRAFEMGADDYITKPFSPFQLMARIATILGRTRQP